MYLMSKDIILAKIDFDKMMFEVYQPDLMPLALRGNNVNLFTVRDWLSDRVLHISRSNAKVIVGALGLDQNNRLQMCFACKGLSLTDCYWLKNENDTSSWRNVNLYTNSLSSAVARIALTGEYISIQGRIRTPELTNGGSYAKCWRRGKDGIYLYKTGSLQGTGKEYLVEILCLDILDKLDVPHVTYTLGKSDSKPVSRCKNMTNENVSICEMEYTMGYLYRNGKNPDNFVRQYEDYFKMLAVDYIIFNADRHLGNWGVYIDANTGKILGLHPLYDHNIALNPRGDYMSKVIPGKTLEECARYSKNYIKLDTKGLIKWLRRKDVKLRFDAIDSSGEFYDSIFDRLTKYNNW